MSAGISRLRVSSWPKGGAVWSVRCVRRVARPATPDDCCYVTTVTSVTTPTAWTRPFLPYLKEPGSASGGSTCQSVQVLSLTVCVFSSLWRCVFSSGVCGVSSVAPPPPGYTVIGRVTTVAVDHVTVWAAVLCVRDSTHRMTSSCSVSSVTGNTHTHISGHFEPDILRDQ